MAGDSSGDSWANAYASFAAWHTAEVTDLQAADEIHTVYCRASSGTADTSLAVINGWNPDATRYVTVIQDDFPADGIFDATKYHLYNNNAVNNTLRIRDDYVRINSLQLKTVGSSTNIRRGIYVTDQAAGTVLLDNIIDVGVMSGTGECPVFILKTRTRM